jgi:uncharacterized protein YjbJ (UPF0337 family)
MSWDRTRGRWKQWKGRAREIWANMTHDELAAVAGQREQIAGLLQEHYGFTRNEAEQQLDSFTRRFAQLRVRDTTPGFQEDGEEEFQG